MFFCLSKDINYGFFDLMSCSLHNLHFFLIHLFLGENEGKLPSDVSDPWLCVHIISTPPKGQSETLSA